MDEKRESYRISRLDLALGAALAGWYALPDVVERRWVRGVVKTSAVSAAAAAVVRLGDPSDEPAVTPASLVGVDPVSADRLLGGEATPAAAPSVVSTLGPAALGLGLSLLGTVLADRVMARTAARLRSRGVRRPYTLMGLGIGAASVLTRPSRQLRA